MMRNAIFILSALTISVVGCRKQASQGEQAPVAASSLLVASLDRGPCRGFCPVYRVEVYSDGKVHFDGKQNVASVGSHDGTTPEADVQKLARAIGNSDVASADSAYVMDSRGCGSYATDLPVNVITVRVDARLKTVRYDPGCRNAPRYLQSLMAQIDSAAHSATWISGKGGKK